MPADEFKAQIRRLFDEVVNEQQLEVLDELVSPNLIFAPDLPPGPQGVKGVVTWLHDTFADLHYTIDDLIAEGEKVAVRLSARGIQKGEYLGYPGTGKAVTFAEFMFFRFADGRIEEWWLVAEQASILQQIGVLPAPK
ncbi:MAG TPA: ester cyclase [Ktedonobacterales bacterium]